MTTARTVEQELDENINWYHSASKRASQRYLAAKITEIVFAAAIAFFAIMPGDWPKYVAGALGAIVSILASVQAVCLWHPKWVSWRTTWQDLVAERIRFNARCGDYAEEDKRITTLADNLCKILKAEFSEWRLNRGDSQKDGKKG